MTRDNRNNCPRCLKPFGHHVEANGGGHALRPGDLSACFGCGALLTFTKTGVERLSAEDLAKLEALERQALLDARLLVLRLGFRASVVGP